MRIPDRIPLRHRRWTLGRASRVILSVLAATLFMQCRDKTAPAATPGSAPSAAPNIAFPNLKATLTGNCINNQGTDSAMLELESDSGRIGGSIRIGTGKPFHFVEANSTHLVSDSSGAALTSRFRLRFAVDLCEDAVPSPPDQPFQWGPCFHYQGAKKPSSLQWDEAVVLIQRMPTAHVTLITVVGVSDSASLSSVYRVTGNIKP